MSAGRGPVRLESYMKKQLKHSHVSVFVLISEILDLEIFLMLVRFIKSSCVLWWWNLKTLKIDVLVTWCILGSVWSLHCAEEESENKERLRARRQREMDHNSTTTRGDFVEPRIKAWEEQRCSYFDAVCLSPSGIFWGSAWRAAPCWLLRDPLELHWFPWSLEKEEEGEGGGGAANRSLRPPPLPSPPASTRRGSELSLTSWCHSPCLYGAACGRHMTKELQLIGVIIICIYFN